MARIKGRVNGQKISMDKTQAAQLGVDKELGVQAQPTGMLDPTQIGFAQPGGPAMVPGAQAPSPMTPGGVDSMRSSVDKQRKLGILNKNRMTPTNPLQQKTMFDTVQAQTKMNPQTDITKRAGEWKNIKGKF